MVVLLVTRAVIGGGELAATLPDFIPLASMIGHQFSISAFWNCVPAEAIPTSLRARRPCGTATTALSHVMLLGHTVCKSTETRVMARAQAYLACGIVCVALSYQGPIGEGVARSPRCSILVVSEMCPKSVE